MSVSFKYVATRLSNISSKIVQWFSYLFGNFRLTTLIDIKKTLEYLAYLGYMYEHDNQLSAIHGMYVCMLF